MTQLPVSFGLHVPYLPEEVDRKELSDYVTEADSLGFDSLWVSDTLFGDRESTLDPFTFLGFAAAQTTRILLGIGAVIFPVRPPIELAKDIATLDVLSSGRTIIALGLGGNPKVYSAFGAEMSERTKDYSARFNALRGLLKGEEVTAAGVGWKVQQAKMYPRPVRGPHPPLWIAGTSEGALRRAARWGDGWLARGSTTPAMLSENVRKVREMARSYGRDPRDIVIAKPTFTAMDEDRDAASKQVRAYLKRYFDRQFDVEGSSILGNADDCKAASRRFIESGLQHIILYPTSLEVDNLRSIAKWIEELRHESSG